MGFDFYNELRKKTEEELKLGDFTFQEIDQGIEDLNKLKNINKYIKKRGIMV